jgi:hypothetical protein
MGQFSVLGNLSLRHSMYLPSKIMQWPTKLAPTPAKNLIASNAWQLPMTPTSGAITPFSEQFKLAAGDSLFGYKHW